MKQPLLLLLLLFAATTTSADIQRRAVLVKHPKHLAHPALIPRGGGGNMIAEAASELVEYMNEGRKADSLLLLASTALNTP
jgi:hypothetical protein